MTRVYTGLILTTIFWGGSFVSAKVLVDTIPPLTSASVRFLLASLFLLGFVLWKREWRWPRKRDWSKFVVLGLTGIYGYNIFFFYGVQLNPAGESALVVALNPIVVAIISVIVLKERLNILQGMGIAISFFGAMLVLTKGGMFNGMFTGLRVEQSILFGAVLCWAIYTIVGKKVMEEYSPLLTTTLAAIVGSLFLWPTMLMVDGFGYMKQAGLLEWSLIVFLAVFVTVLGFVWYYEGVRSIGAGRAAVFINIVPISALLFSVVFLNEVFGWLQLVGGLLVITGVYITTKGRVLMDRIHSCRIVEQN